MPSLVEHPQSFPTSPSPTRSPSGPPAQRIAKLLKDNPPLVRLLRLLLRAGGLKRWVNTATLKAMAKDEGPVVGFYVQALAEEGLVELREEAVRLAPRAARALLTLRTGVTRPSPAPAPPPPSLELGRVLKQSDQLAEQLYQRLGGKESGIDWGKFRRDVHWSVLEVLGLSGRPQSPTPGAHPLELSPAEQTLEQVLSQTCHEAYKDIPWHERTKLFSDIWDRQRRIRLGVLHTYFSDFRPRWQHPAWHLFNQARRQADARGAVYEDWISAQFEQMEREGRNDVLPKDLCGPKAVEAYERRHAPEAISSAPVPGAPPYEPNTYDPHNPQHVSYALEVIRTIEKLAPVIYGPQQAEEGMIRLAMEAYHAGTLPIPAMDMRPNWKKRLLEELSSAQGLKRPEAPTPSPAHTLLI